MRVLLFLALLLPAVALAQPVCWPAPVGSGTLPVVLANGSGRVVAWGCVTQFEARRYAFGGPLIEWPSDWIARGRALATGPEADRVAAWTKAGRMPAELQPLVDAALAQVEVARPVWTVARNATYLTRPAYAIADGIRGTVSVGRAAVGAPCDCKVRSVEGSSVYCQVAAGQVALCVK